MIQAVDRTLTQGLVAPLKPQAPAAPLAVQSQTVSAASLQADQIKIQGGTFSDEEALAALTALSQKYGSLRKPGFFKNPKIDNNEVLDRLKKGKNVIAYNKDVHDKHDTFDSFEELMLLDDLQGRKGDHGVAKPEIRLPLLFLEKQKLEPYNSNNNERLDPYNAYDDLKRGWRILVNHKAVKPGDLAGYVIRSGWTEAQDPGQKVRSQFSRLPEGGWQINGQAASRDLAYLAYITGASNLGLDGVAVRDHKDFALLLNLVDNEPNQALAAGLRERLTQLKLQKFSSPVHNLYSVYKNLEKGQALRYDGNTLNTLDEMVVYDALQGSHKPSELLPNQVQQALFYLAQDQGLSTANAFQAWQSLKAGESVSYDFKGGPTGENIRYQAHSLETLLTMQAQVVEQRRRDQFRPDLKQAKQIMADRLPGLQAGVTQNLQRTRQAVARARADIPVQEANRDQAQQDYHRIKPEYDRALLDYQQAEQKSNSAQRHFESDKRSYEWELDKYQRYEREYRSSQQRYERAQREAKSYENQARKEEGLASSDPQNADAHRRKASDLRNKAQSAHTQADRYRRDMDSARRDMDRQRWDVDRTRRDMDASQRRYWDARSEMESAKSAWQYQQSQLSEATDRQRQAENQLAAARQTVADGDVIEHVSASVTRQLDLLQKGMGRLGSYADYAHERQGLQNAAAALQQQLNNGTYARVHGEGILRSFAPLQTLLSNMDKPAQK